MRILLARASRNGHVAAWALDGCFFGVFQLHIDRKTERRLKCDSLAKTPMRIGRITQRVYVAMERVCGAACDRKTARSSDDRNSQGTQRTSLPAAALLRHADCIKSCPLWSVTRKTFAQAEFFAALFQSEDLPKG